MFDVDVVASDRVSSVKTREVRGEDDRRPPGGPAAGRHDRLPDAVGRRRRVDRGRKRCARASRCRPRTTPSPTRTQVRHRDRLRAAVATTRTGRRGASADRAAPRRRARADRADLDRRGHLARQRAHGAPQGAAGAARLGRAGLDAVRGLRPLRPRAALRPARHRDAHVDAAELRHEGLRRPGAAVGQLRLQRRAAAAEGLDPERRHAHHDRRGVTLGRAQRVGLLSTDTLLKNSGRTFRRRPAHHGGWEWHHRFEQHGGHVHDPGFADCLGHAATGPAQRRRDIPYAPASAAPATPAPDPGDAAFDKAIQPDRERPDAQPGALLRATVDTDHWLSAGSDGETQVVIEGSRVFAPSSSIPGATSSTTVKGVTGGLGPDLA